MLKVGYIGLGLMGKPIARNILRAGYPLVVHNRSQGSVNELVKEGAVPAENPSQVAQQVDVIFTNLNGPVPTIVSGSKLIRSCSI